MAGLHKVAIGIRTFLRDDKLMVALGGIRETMPDAQILIADCGEMTTEKSGVYADIVRDGGKVQMLPFAVGLGAMSNALIDMLDRPFLLMGSDDFNFRPAFVRTGIEKMVDILDHTEVDVIGGRVFGHGEYEFDLEDRGEVVLEHKINTNVIPTPYFIYCDLTVNYSMFKREVFSKVRWEQDVPIMGGEHGAQFIKLKRNGYKVAWASGVEIEEQKGEDSLRYKRYRARHTDPPRVCFDRIGVKKYVLGSGQIDYDITRN